jgi:hypothetical protein
MISSKTTEYGVFCVFDLIWVSIVVCIHFSRRLRPNGVCVISLGLSIGFDVFALTCSPDVPLYYNTSRTNSLSGTNVRGIIDLSEFGLHLLLNKGSRHRHQVHPRPSPRRLEHHPIIYISGG